MTITRSALLVMLCIPLISNADNFFDNTAGAIITSPANAKGVDNVDCSSSDVDTIATIESKVCVIDDQLNVDFNGTFSVLGIVENRVSIIESKVNAGLCEPMLIQDSDLPLTISASGMYLVTENLDLLTSNTLITINADDVTIDMCGFEASGSYASDVTGIAIRSGHENITIKNGKFRDLTRGIIVENTNDRIILQDLAFSEIHGDQAGDRVIDFAGTSALASITNSIVRNVIITDSGPIDADTNFFVELFLNTYCMNHTIENIRFESNSAGFIYSSLTLLDQLRLLTIEDCENVMINDIKEQDNTTDGAFFGIIIATCQSVSVRNCMFSGNTSIGDMLMCGVASASASVSMEDILLTDNTSTQATFEGIFSITGSTDLKLSRINVNNNNSSGEFRGISIRANISTSVNTIMEDCIVSSNMSDSGAISAVYVSQVNDVIARRIMASNNISYSNVNSRGFLISDSQRIVLEDCQSFNNDNSGVTTSSRGFFLTDSSGSVQAILKNCIADTHCRAGFELDGATDTMLIDCFAKNTDSYTDGIGFYVSSEVSSRVMFMGCIAENNFDGFNVSVGINDSQFKDCIALKNTNDGFFIDTPTNVEIKDCQAIFNDNSGFEFSGSTATTTMLRNVSCNNGYANYVNEPTGFDFVAPIYSDSGWDNIDCP